MKNVIQLAALGFILFYSEQCSAQYLDPLDEVRFIPSTSWLHYVLSFLTIPIIYLIISTLKNMLIIAWNSDLECEIEEVEESKVLTKKQAKNKNIVKLLNRFFEALIFIGITILLLVFNFYYDIIYMKWYYIDDDLFGLGWVITPIWIVFQDFIIISYKKGMNWYAENSKL